MSLVYRKGYVNLVGLVYPFNVIGLIDLVNLVELVDLVDHFKLV